jgi:hypothetical protein
MPPHQTAEQESIAADTARFMEDLAAPGVEEDREVFAYAWIARCLRAGGAGIAELRAWLTSGQDISFESGRMVHPDKVEEDPATCEVSSFPRWIGGPTRMRWTPQWSSCAIQACGRCSGYRRANKQTWWQRLSCRDHRASPRNAGRGDRAGCARRLDQASSRLS